MQCMSDRFNRLEDDVDAARLQSVVITDGTGDILQIVIWLFACEYL